MSVPMKPMIVLARCQCTETDCPGPHDSVECGEPSIGVRGDLRLCRLCAVAFLSDEPDWELNFEKQGGTHEDEKEN